MLQACKLSLYCMCCFFTLQICKLTLLDDTADPRVEGNETFVVFLSAAMGSALAEPYSAVVTINDTNLDSKY